MSARETARARERARTFLPVSRAAGSVGITELCVIICDGLRNTAALQHRLAEAGVVVTAVVSVINNYVEY